VLPEELRLTCALEPLEDEDLTREEECELEGEDRLLEFEYE